MRTPLVRGRVFDERDRADTERVMLIDESLAKRFWGDADPIGTRMYRPTYPDDLNRTDADTQFYTVVGIVPDVQLRDLAGKGARAFGSFYLPQAQWPERNNFVAIETRASSEAVMNAVRAEVARLDPLLPLFDVRTMTERTDLSLASRKLALGLSATFGVVALLLAALGIYGVLAYLVAQRRREIGIRMALGSSPRAVFRLVLGEGLWLTVTGLTLGVAGALAVASVLKDQVFGIAPTDPPGARRSRARDGRNRAARVRFARVARNARESDRRADGALRRFSTTAAARGRGPKHADATAAVCLPVIGGAERRGPPTRSPSERLPL
jgi:hypothetical protein